MKIRQCFVANSSSSSFVCEICGHTETGFDAGLSDLGFVECVNEHVFCEEHRLNDETSEEGSNYYELPESTCPICQFQEYSQPELCTYLQKTYNVDRNEIFEEIKKVNRRRKKLYNHEYIAEVLKRNNITDDSVLEMLKSQFKTYKEFTEFIRG